ncbi:hypothetical protein FGL91_06315 [Microbacterium sp. CBA3102]|nr:hypothetical protein FGL91_06315 [Microbacterium sp. CBA3102]
MCTTLSTTESVQYAYAAVQNLQHGRSTIEIAEELGISRFLVGRMIRRAREDGLVEVRTRLPEPIAPELSKALSRAYGLESAFVALTPSNDETRTRTTIASIGARFLSETIGEDAIVGLGPGRTILDTCDRIREVATCDVVQLTGFASVDAGTHLEAISQLSGVAKGRMFALPASFVTRSARSWEAVTREPAVQQALARIDHIDMAALTVGGWPGSSLLASQLDELDELAPLLRRGVVAELGTTLLDTDGNEVDGLHRRLIGITTAQLERTPTRIALGGGAGKQRAVLAALRSGLVTTLITDEGTARAALDAL